MALKIVTITIDEKGDSEFVLDGFAGKGCDAIAKGFEKAVGVAKDGIKHNADFNKPCQTKTQLQARS
jgi:hypothetical protein